MDRWTVSLTRISKGKLDEGDNLNSSFKFVRDAIAEWLGVDDGSDRYDWRYAQERGEPGIRILIEGSK